MEQRGGGCCIARYATSGSVYNMSKVDRVMMKFCPIAPKPTSPNSNTTPKIPEPSVKSTGRRKRRNPTNKTNVIGKKRKSPFPEYSISSPTRVEKSVKTLSFLPEEPGVKEVISPCKKRFPQWLSFSNVGGHVSSVIGHVGSYVKVECVIDTWLMEERTDEERLMCLDVDTCPGFVTDGLNRVRWMNAACRNNIVGEVAVVVERGVVIPVGIAGFTCRVRVVTGGGGGEKGGWNSKTVLCDVWRMKCGGFAWRLDTDAALSLGR